MAVCTSIVLVYVNYSLPPKLLLIGLGLNSLHVVLRLRRISISKPTLSLSFLSLYLTNGAPWSTLPHALGVCDHPHLD